MESSRKVSPETVSNSEEVQGIRFSQEASQQGSFAPRSSKRLFYRLFCICFLIITVSAVAMATIFLAVRYPSFASSFVNSSVGSNISAPPFYIILFHQTAILQEKSANFRISLRAILFLIFSIRVWEKSSRSYSNL